MPPRSDVDLSRRERQIMDAVYALGQASVTQVHQALSDPPSYSAVRTLMGILVEKGHLRHQKDGARYLYLPTRSRQQAGRSAARRLLETFFDGSAEQAVAALLQESDAKLDPEAIGRLRRMIDGLRKEGR